MWDYRHVQAESSANSKLRLLPHSCHEFTQNILPYQTCVRNVALSGLRAFANEFSVRTSLSKRRQFLTLVQSTDVFSFVYGLEDVDFVWAFSGKMRKEIVCQRIKDRKAT